MLHCAEIHIKGATFRGLSFVPIIMHSSIFGKKASVVFDNIEVSGFQELGGFYQTVEPMALGTFHLNNSRFLNSTVLGSPFYLKQTSLPPTELIDFIACNTTIEDVNFIQDGNEEFGEPFIFLSFLETSFSSPRITIQQMMVSNVFMVKSALVQIQGWVMSISATSIHVNSLKGSKQASILGGYFNTWSASITDITVENSLNVELLRKDIKFKESIWNISNVMVNSLMLSSTPFIDLEAIFSGETSRITMDQMSFTNIQLQAKGLIELGTKNQINFIVLISNTLFENIYCDLVLQPVISIVISFFFHKYLAQISTKTEKTIMNSDQSQSDMNLIACKISFVNLTINNIGNSLSTQREPFIRINELEQVSVRDVILLELHMFYFMNAYDVSSVKVVNVSMLENSLELKAGVFVLSGLNIVLDGLFFQGIFSTRNIIQVEALQAMHVDCLIANSHFINNTIVIDTKTPPTTAQIVFSGNLNGNITIRNSSFEDSTLQIEKVPTSGFLLAPNIVVDGQQIDFKIEDSLFRGTQVISSKVFIINLAISDLFASNIWVFANSLTVLGTRFVNYLKN